MSANFSNAMLTGIGYLPGSGGIVSWIFPPRLPQLVESEGEKGVRRARSFFEESRRGSIVRYCSPISRHEPAEGSLEGGGEGSKRGVTPFRDEDESTDRFDKVNRR